MNKESSAALVPRWWRRLLDWLSDPRDMDEYGLRPGDYR